MLVNGPGGELFFEADGTLGKAVAEVLDFLTHVQGNHEATIRICNALQGQDLIEPWPIRLEAPEGEQNIEGLYRINERALNAMHGDAFIQLRDAGALPVAYCQLLSMQNLAVLSKLADARSVIQPLSTLPSGELNLDFLPRVEPSHLAICSCGPTATGAISPRRYCLDRGRSRLF